MTAERFLALAAAYGADRRRWPEGDRAAAEAFASAHPDLARPVLAEADALDALLHGSPTPQVSTALRDRVLAAATSAGGRAHRAGRQREQSQRHRRGQNNLQGSGGQPSTSVSSTPSSDA